MNETTMTLADEFRGKRVLVTGGTRGIGAAICPTLCFGWRVGGIVARSLLGGSAVWPKN